METLVLIPARGGSKGLPGKNIKLLNGKPLIHYSIEIAREIFSDKDICVSTDDLDTISVVEEVGLKVPFVRPGFLASDNASTRDVIIHALDFYKNKGISYQSVLLLQPTSPFRNKTDIIEMLKLKKENDADMIVSVAESKMNPYYNLFEEVNGYLVKSKKGSFLRRQDCPPVYSYNGSLYVFKSNSVREKEFHEFTKICKFVMDEEKYNIDIDTEMDWLIAEQILIGK